MFLIDRNNLTQCDALTGSTLISRKVILSTPQGRSFNCVHATIRSLALLFRRVTTMSLKLPSHHWSQSITPQWHNEIPTCLQLIGN